MTERGLWRTTWMLLATTACGGTAAFPPVETPTVGVGEARYDVTTLTDTGAVQDVARSATYVYVATDRGLLVYAGSGMGVRPTRLTAADGLPALDVQAVAVGSNDRVLAATEHGVGILSGDRVVGTLPAAPVGVVTDLAFDTAGTLWAGGSTGLARLRGDRWERVGEPAEVTRVAPIEPHGGLWVGTMSGLWRLEEDDVVREHRVERGLPGEAVLDVVPSGEDRALALLDLGGETMFGWYDGQRWYGYGVEQTIRPVGLARREEDVLLVTDDGAWHVAAASVATGEPLFPLEASDGDVTLSYRAGIDVPPDDDDRRPRREANEKASPMTHPVEEDEPVPAPAFVLRPLARWANDTTLVRTSAGRLYLADRGRGVVEVSGLEARGTGEDTSVRRLASRDLVREQDLALAADAEGHVWLVTRDGALGRYVDGRLEVVEAPAGTVPQAVAEGPGGAYVATLVPSAPGVVRVYHATTPEWELVLERTAPVAGTLVGISFLAVSQRETCWVGITIEDLESGETEPQGVLVLDPRSEGAIHLQGDESLSGALAIPDDVTSVALDEDGGAWFPTLGGAIRIDGGAREIYGEAQGVRGEVVTDVAPGPDRVWLAAAEGLGFIRGDDVDFGPLVFIQPQRPTRIAVGPNGDLWAVGDEGLIHVSPERFAWDGRTFEQLEGENLERRFRDVSVDGRGRVWLLGDDRVLVLTPH